MSKEDYPEKATKDDFPELVERAERIREKYLQGRYLIFLIGFIFVPTMPIALGSFSFMLWLLQNHYLDFLPLFPMDIAVKMFFVLFAILLVVVCVPLIAFLIFSATRLMQKYLGYPRHEEIIFAQCFIMANHLRNNDRLKAKKEVGFFLTVLKGFVRHLIFNPKRTVYSPEFNTLRSGKNEICRMLMFSRNDTSELLMNFGLAFVRNDDPEAFSLLQQLVNEVKKYGEPKGRVRRFLSEIEQYPHASPFILTIIIVVIAILYYGLSGQQLPI